MASDIDLAEFTINISARQNYTLYNNTLLSCADKHRVTDRCRQEYMAIIS